MTSMDSAKVAIIEKVSACLALARSLYPDYRHPDPVIKFELRGRSTGGTALGSRELDFNLDWYAADPELFLKIVVPHEVAHIVDEALYPTIPRVAWRRGRMVRVRQTNHGRTWVRICLALGGDGKTTCPLFKAAERRRITWEYRYNSLSGAEKWVGPSHHKRLQTVHGYYVTFVHGGRVVRDGFTGVRRQRA